MSQIEKIRSLQGVISVRETDEEVLVYINIHPSKFKLPLNESGDKPVKLIPPMNG